MASAAPTILQIIPRLDTGGAELMTIEITDAIVRGGGIALVATEGGRMAERIGKAGGTLIPLSASSKSPIRMLANAAALVRLARDRHVGLIHARSRAPAWSAIIAARHAGLPFVTTYHGAYAERGPLKRLYNSVMARGDVVIANSAFTAELIKRRYGTPSGRLRVIHRGIDARQFDGANIPAGRLAELRRSWGVGEHTRVVLQAARLTGWKGQGVVVAAADLLRRDRRVGDWTVILAGDAQGRTGYTEALRQDIGQRGLERLVRIVGHVDDMPAAFAAAHVAVVASIEPEGFGRTATEAQAMGCPVIATDIGAPRETVLATPHAPACEATGWLVPPGDARSLADGLAQALTMTPAARGAMGERARRHVTERFALSAMKRATLEVYDELLGSKMASRLEPLRSASGPR